MKQAQHVYTQEDPVRARFNALPTPTVTEHGRGLAQRCVAVHARDADECLELLRMLGLDDDPQ